MPSLQLNNPLKLNYEAKVILCCVFLLVLFGLMMTYSSSSIFAMEKKGDQFFYLRRQAVFAVLGFILMFAAISIPFRSFYSPWVAYSVLLAGLFFMIFLHLSPAGQLPGVPDRWLKIGPIKFQPSEVAKLSLVIYMSYSLAKKQPKIETFSIGFLPHIIIILVFLILIMMEPDFGTTAFLALIAFLMMLAAGVRLKHLFLSSALAGVAFYLLIISSPYRLARIKACLNPWEDPRHSGFQLIQSFVAFGSGGLWGKGLGNGSQKLFFLPAAHTDFIYAVVGEELGFIGVLIVLFLFFILVWCGIRISLLIRDAFGALLALGLTLSIGLQALINFCVALGILPTKGLTLPFLSYGGTSLVTSMVSAGLLVSVALSVEEDVS